MRLTQEQHRAIRLLRHADPRYEGEGVVYAGGSALLDRQAWINYRTADALARRGLAVVSGEGEECAVRLVDPLPRKRR